VTGLNVLLGPGSYWLGLMPQAALQMLVLLLQLPDLGSQRFEGGTAREIK
jgi:hypothetical protein